MMFVKIVAETHCADIENDVTESGSLLAILVAQLEDYYCNLEHRGSPCPVSNGNSVESGDDKVVQLFAKLDDAELARKEFDIEQETDGGEKEGDKNKKGK